MQMMDILENEDIVDFSGHLFNVEGHPACCRKATAQGLVDCVACLDDAWSVLCHSLDPDSLSAAEWILNTVRQAGEAGIRKGDILVCIQ